MQHMTHISALGALVDDILSDKESILYLSPKEADAIEDINAYLNATLEYTLQTKNNQMSASLITAPLAGYGAAKLIDTNYLDSEIKTGSTMLLGLAASKVADVLVSSAITPRPKEEDNAPDVTGFTTGKGKITAAVTDNAIEALTLLKSRNLIDGDQFAVHKAAIEDELARAATIEKIKGYVDLASGIASGYHGYKRNGDSILYGLAWALTMKTGLGVALAQGYAKPIN